MSQTISTITLDADVQGLGVVNRKIILKRIPLGQPRPSDFEVMTDELPAIADGQTVPNKSKITPLMTARLPETLQHRPDCERHKFA